MQTFYWCHDKRCVVCFNWMRSVLIYFANYMKYLMLWLILVTLACGKTTSENCTYLTLGATTTAVAQPTCVYTICKYNPNICRIRLDFLVRFVTHARQDFYQSKGFGLDKKQLNWRAHLFFRNKDNITYIVENVP